MTLDWKYVCAWIDQVAETARRVDLFGEDEQQPGDGHGHPQADEEAGQGGRQDDAPNACQPSEADHVCQLADNSDRWTG